MQTYILKWGIVLIAALMAVWVWSEVPLAAAGVREVKPKAPVPETGQTDCWDGSGSSTPCLGTRQDGEIQAGVSWPIPRFTDRGNGTVRDNLTGLIWLQHANCFPGNPGVTWQDALDVANALASPSCGLSDGSVEGDWRLPNIKELQSLIDFGQEHPAFPAGHPFSNVQSEYFSYYWTSTTVFTVLTFPLFL